MCARSVAGLRGQVSTIKSRLCRHRSSRASRPLTHRLRPHDPTPSILTCRWGLSRLLRRLHRRYRRRPYQCRRQCRSSSSNRCRLLLKCSRRRQCRKGPPPTAGFNQDPSQQPAALLAGIQQQMGAMAVGGVPTSNVGGSLAQQYAALGQQLQQQMGNSPFNVRAGEFTPQAALISQFANSGMGGPGGLFSSRRRR